MEPSPSGPRRIAFFGGSFDPPHLGHLAVARAARQALALDAVLFAPVGAQPLKAQGATARFDDRVAMTRLAIAGEPGLEVSLADAPRPAGSPNYTLDTLLALRAELPPDASLFCLIGADSFLGLRQWHRAAEIPFVAPLIVAARPGERLADLRASLPDGLSIVPDAEIAQTAGGVELRTIFLANAAGARAPLYLLPGLAVDISASELREWVRAKRHADGASLPPRAERGLALLPPAVCAYIRQHCLYG